jgi:WD40 repeat protein
MAKGNTVILWRFTTGTGRTKQLTSPNGEFARISCLTFGLRNMENKKSLVLAAGDEKGHLLVWDVESQKVINDQANFHKGAVRCVAFASESGLLASGGDDGQVRLWNLGGKKPDRTPRRHRAPIRSVVFSPKAGFFDLSRPQPLAPLLCSACQENEVRLWVLGPGVGNDQYLPGYTMGTFSPDGAWFALANEKGTVSLVRYDHIDRPIPLFEGQVGEIQKAKVWGKNSRRVSTAGLSHGKYRHGLGHRKPPVPNQLAVTCL